MDLFLDHDFWTTIPAADTPVRERETVELIQLPHCQR